MTDPILSTWDGDAMVPSTSYWARIANERFVVGQRYRIVEENEQSDKSRAHEFAWLAEAWQSLPDALYAQYPNSEVLRKHALIDKGHCTLKQHACMSVAEAERLAAILKPYDAYAIVIQRGSVVSVYTAVSQSRRAMGAKAFQKSKQDVLDFVSGLLGVAPETLAKVGEAA